MTSYSPATPYAVTLGAPDPGASLGAIGAWTNGVATITTTLSVATSNQTITVKDGNGISGTSSSFAVTGSILHTYPTGLTMISLPTDYSGQPVASVLGYASPTLAVWESAAGTYVVTPTPPADALRVGQGYWVRFPAVATVTYLGAAAASPITIALATGWNMIGCPRSSAVPTGSLSVIDSQNVSHTMVMQRREVVCSRAYSIPGNPAIRPTRCFLSIQEL